MRRLARQGAVVTTSESWLYEVMGDAAVREFRAVAGLVREEKGRTGEGVRVLGEGRVTEMGERGI